MTGSRVAAWISSGTAMMPWQTGAGSRTGSRGGTKIRPEERAEIGPEERAEIRAGRFREQPRNTT